MHILYEAFPDAMDNKGVIRVITVVLSGSLRTCDFLKKATGPEKRRKPTSITRLSARQFRNIKKRPFSYTKLTRENY
jgi:hypothetical protein